MKKKVQGVLQPLKKNKFNYEIELKKVKHLYKSSNCQNSLICEKNHKPKEEYKEIEIIINQNKINEINNDEKTTYYGYLDSQDIFGPPIPYYTLFDFSIDDMYDDLNI